MVDSTTTNNLSFDLQNELRTQLKKVLPNLGGDVSISLTDTLSDRHNPYLFDSDFGGEPEVQRLMNLLILAVKNEDKHLMWKLITDLSNLYYEPQRIIKRVFHNQDIFNLYHKENDHENVFYTSEQLIKLNQGKNKLYPNQAWKFDQKFIDLGIFIDPKVYKTITGDITGYKLDFDKIAQITGFVIPHLSK